MNESNFTRVGGTAAILFVLFLSAIPVLFSATSTQASDKPEIKVGQIVGLTGPVPDLGSDAYDAVVDFTNYQNEKGGIKGHKIKLITLDCSYDTDKEIAGYRKLMEQKVSWFYGFHSTVQFKLRQEFMDKGFMTYGSPDIKNLIAPSHTFSPYITYFDQNLAVMNWASQTMVKPVRIAYYCIKGHHSSTYIQPMKENAPKLGVELVKVYINDASKTNFEAEILENIKDGVNLILNHSTEALMIAMIKDAARLGYKGKQLHRTLSTNVIPKLGRELAQGLYGIFPVAPFGDVDVPGIKLAWEFQKKYHPVFGETGRGYWYGQYAANAMLAHQVAEQVIEEKGFENLNGKNIVEMLERGREYTAMGLVPNFRFSKEYHGAMPSYLKIGQVKGEDLVGVSDWIKALPRTPDQLRLEYYK